jgi:hypothetical protein
VLEKDYEKNKIPVRLKPLFWSYKFESLSLEKNRKFITKQILNYGTIEDWKWLVSVYTKEGVKETISKLYETELSKGSLKLAEILFNSKPSHVSRNIG